jgi:hypothetical protein
MDKAFVCDFRAVLFYQCFANCTRIRLLVTELLDLCCVNFTRSRNWLFRFHLRFLGAVLIILRLTDFACIRSR